MVSRKKEIRLWRTGVAGAFTLIELLIVVAIIAILAAIAVPNFLEAQTRAKVARNMNDLRTMVVALQAYRVDWNDILRDQNDYDTPSWRRYPPYNFLTENPNLVPDIRFIGTRAWTASFHTYAQWVPLSTPVAYTTMKPKDGFSSCVPFGLDTREINREIVYWVILSAGPDMDDGDWYRGHNNNAVDRNMAVKYDPTNGTISNGDIWRGEYYKNKADFDREYPFAM